jgi:hypothetical protein
MTETHLTRIEAAARARVCVRIIDTAVAARELAHIRIGDRVFIREAALQTWLDGCEIPATQNPRSRKIGRPTLLELEARAERDAASAAA